MKYGLLLVDGKVNFKLPDVEWTYTLVGQLPDTDIAGMERVS